MKTAIPLKQVIAGFSSARKKHIKARAGELIAEEMALRDIRKSRARTPKNKSPNASAASKSMCQAWKAAPT